MAKKALLVIDMQNDFILKGSKLEVRNIRKGLPKFKKFIDKVRQKKITIIFTRHIYDNPSPGEKQLFPDIVKSTLQKKSRGAEIHASIKPIHRDIVIDKNRYDAFFKTNLNKLLKKKAITELIITGTMTDVCCSCTAHSAMINDYNLIFVSDLTFTSSKVAQKATLKNIASNFGRVLSSSKVLKEL